MNEDIIAARKDMRSCERKYRQTRLTVHKEIVSYKRRQVKKMTRRARTTYYASKIEDQSCNNKAFFQTIGSISHTKSDSVLPDYTSLMQMLEKFSNYFVDKVAAIRQSNQDVQIVNDERITPPPELSSFTPSTVDEVVKLIKQSATKSCQLDPIPTHLLKVNL